MVRVSVGEQEGPGSNAAVEGVRSTTLYTPERRLQVLLLRVPHRGAVLQMGQYQCGVQMSEGVGCHASCDPSNEG